MCIRVSKYTHIPVQYTRIIQWIVKTELVSLTNLKFCSESSLLKDNWRFLLGSDYGQTFAHDTTIYTFLSARPGQFYTRGLGEGSAWGAAMQRLGMRA